MEIPIISDILREVFIFFCQIFSGNVGLSIIAITVITKVVLLPLVVPSMRSAKKMQDLKPEIDRLKAKITDKTAFQQAQIALYKEKGINPAAGCLPQIFQIIILIALYKVFNDFLKNPPIDNLYFKFLFLDLTSSDRTYILPIFAGITQLVFSLMMQSGIVSEVKNPKKKDEKKKEENKLEMATSMQQQMVYMMPLMTIIISANPTFPSGIVFYWVLSTIFSIVQQYFFSGWGGLIPALNKAKLLLYRIAGK